MDGEVLCVDGAPKQTAFRGPLVDAFSAELRAELGDGEGGCASTCPRTGVEPLILDERNAGAYFKRLPSSMRSKWSARAYLQDKGPLPATTTRRAPCALACRAARFSPPSSAKRAGRHADRFLAAVGRVLGNTDECCWTCRTAARAGGHEGPRAKAGGRCRDLLKRRRPRCRRSLGTQARPPHAPRARSTRRHCPWLRTRGAVGRVGFLRAVGVASGVRGDACCWCVEGPRRGAPPDRLSNKSRRRRFRKPGRLDNRGSSGSPRYVPGRAARRVQGALRDACPRRGRTSGEAREPTTWGESVGPSWAVPAGPFFFHSHFCSDSHPHRTADGSTGTGGRAPAAGAERTSHFGRPNGKERRNGRKRFPLHARTRGPRR